MGIASCKVVCKRELCFSIIKKKILDQFWIYRRISSIVQRVSISSKLSFSYHRLALPVAQTQHFSPLFYINRIMTIGLT